MTEKIPKTVCAAINGILHGSYNIRHPKIKGSQQNVYFIDSTVDTFVLKFNKQNIVQKNEIISHVLHRNNIPAPQITALKHNGNWFEIYKHIPGKTLYEQIGSGMDSDKIKTAYREIVNSFAKMSEIDIYKLPKIECLYAHQVAGNNVTNTNNALLGSMFQLLVRMLNHGSVQDARLCHSGLTPKNVIVSDTGHLTGILDVDEVAICNQGYAFAAMAAKYQQLGYDITDLFDYYETITGRELDRKRINSLVNFLNVGKKILWATSHNKSR